MNAPYDKNGKTISKGSYVKFNNNLWEVFNWKASDTGAWTLVWLEPRAENESAPQWGYDTDIEVTDLQQLHFEL
jgi:hypothetical protein